jgi:hypothetical protein
VFDGDKVTEVQGNLTLLGKTQPVTLKASQFNCYQSPMLKREVCGGDFETTIDRTAFGMNYGIDWGFPKNVRLVIRWKPSSSNGRNLTGFAPKPENKNLGLWRFRPCQPTL